MIAGYLHSGSGLGNQLFRTVAVKVRALDLGVDFGMLNPENFKGANFMYLDMGSRNIPSDMKVFNEKKVIENGVDIRGTDPEYFFIEDNTILDGEFQDERYFGHRMKEIDEWLRVEPIDMPDDLCVIGFRGGEFVGVPDLFLPQDYWDEAIGRMIAINPKMKFEVHTDDPITAQEFFPYLKIIHDIGINWRSVRFAKYAIIANSSFYILPRLLAHHEDINCLTLAPRFWARYNTHTWALPCNYYKQFKYIHHEKS